jgi:hypothetical protein
MTGTVIYGLVHDVFHKLNDDTVHIALMYKVSYLDIIHKWLAGLHPLLTQSSSSSSCSLARRLAIKPFMEARRLSFSA